MPRTVVAVLMVGVSVWLVWAIIVSALIVKAPPAVALTVAPGSPTALFRSANARQRAGDQASAERQARASLSRAPFNARALSVLGSSFAVRGDTTRADSILTLAGNWSLRDSKTHMWLFQHRLAAGEAASAFAHLDTVLRRRADMHERLFPVVRQAAITDPRLHAIILDRLALAPNWRRPFLVYLAKDSRGSRLAAALATGLNRSSRPLSSDETRQIVSRLLGARQFAELKSVARGAGLIGRTPVRDAGFENAPSAPPFGWDLMGGVGATVEIRDDDEWKSRVMSIDYDGLSTAPLARQLIGLAPGAYVLTTRSRIEGGQARLYWQISCAGGLVVSSPPLRGAAARIEPAVFEVPGAGCDLQWLELKARPGERTASITAILDDLTIRPGQGLRPLGPVG